ncbi:sensor domain-containing diguanylate cyclase [Desulfopila aestuarii]|uniref:PAS domain S-box-containing protein/diguanylate cyclase (GGDEF) domain-containing protein n=1 Tax=Desulfopila aestuarii DSM 18488 TaxID=1121416 RepID=A0A1M7YE13_9BACT|nr:diguanylate cyclase [Desulfopila aestuarii]SHO50843.1 PAS domain S-box-containing protein/diguanylate cyclase (GGDEF) domain-containing protein [Desulfopila aestuarii DSM 18488]
MGLRATTLAVIGTILVLMIVLISSISKVIVLDGYSRLENDKILESAEQVLRMVDDEVGQVKIVTGDWAPWDDTYQFVQDGNQDYIDDNLSDSTINNLPVDFIIYIGPERNLLYCKYVDPETEEDATCPNSIQQFALSPFIQRSDENGETISGLAMLGDVPAIIAAAPIMTSQFTGPAMGTLLAGRFLFPKEIQRLATKIGLALQLESLAGSDLSEDFSLAREHLTTGAGKAVVERIDAKNIAAYSLLFDVQDSPILMLGIKTDRQIFAEGKKSLLYIIIAICITGLVCIVATMLFLETRVLSRVVRLNHEVQDIGTSGNLLKKATVEGKDELAGLSSAINQMVDSVRISTERDRAILESMEDGYFELDLEGRITFFNQALAKLFGYPEKNISDVHYRHLMDRKSASQTVQAMKRLYATGRPIIGMETGFTLENGKQLFLESTISLIRDADGMITGFRGIARDVTERKKAAEELLYLAYHDGLTGLFNRKAFYEHLKNELLYAERYSQQRSLLYIDLDKFKKVNDTFGHAIGDVLLKQFCARVVQVLRNADKFFRLGGDEFVIVLSEPQAHSPEVVAERVLALMKKPFEIGSERIDFVSASIGISMFPTDGQDIDILLLKADSSMYRAKERGGAGIVAAERDRKV